MVPVVQAAAFFDLDRTLVVGASGPILSAALQSEGLGPPGSIPGLPLFYQAYNLFGESLPAMALARSTVLALRGAPRERVRSAARRAVDRLEEMVAPYAPSLLDEHRHAGRALVLTTTTPIDLIEPLADRLGFDDVIATRFGQRNGRYTGRLDGPYVWAAGKLTAVRRWAARASVDLAESFAYSDSVYDLPLLSSVGHPTAVNPDARLAVVAGLRRWPQLHLDAPPGVPKLFGLEPFDVARFAIRPELFPYVRFGFEGVERIPTRGPAIVVANHRSPFDIAALAVTLTKAGRRPRALVNKELFDAPVLGSLARLFGQIMVDPGAGGDDEAPDGLAGVDALARAVPVLRAGEVVVVLPHGPVPSRAARLAAATRTPVVPVGLWGTERVWPPGAWLPNVKNLLHPPSVLVRVGKPVAGLGLVDAAVDAATINAAIADLLPPGAEDLPAGPACTR